MSRIVVYNLGERTFDVSLLSINDGVFEVLATTGDTHLGGEDSDNRVIDYLTKQHKKTGTDVANNYRVISKLKCEVEKAKHTILSSQQCPCILEDGNDFSEILTHAKFEQLNMSDLLIRYAVRTSFLTV